MKRRFMLSVLATLMVLVLAIPALARPVTFVNGCGFTIAALSISDTNSSNASDILGNNVLPAGASITIDIQGGDSGWDLIAVSESGSNVAFENISFQGVSTVTLRRDGTADLR